MVYYKNVIYYFAILLPCIIHTWHEQGIICVPVADLVGQPMKNFYGKSIIGHSWFYKTLPECGAGNFSNALLACPRIHQALLHDPVEIIRQRGSEVCVKIENTVLFTNNTIYRKTFWTQKSNVMPCTQIENMALVGQCPLITLVKPIYIEQLNITLSAGTQLPYLMKEKDSTAIAVYILNKQNKKFELYSIPKDHSIDRIHTSIDDKIKLFVSLLRDWANHTNGQIPYVWGGSSFTNTVPNIPFQEQTIHIPNGTLQQAYTYPSNTNIIKTGFDCSGLISRAAQIAGIPYYCKNSLTAAKLLKPLSKNDLIEPGDLLWFSGHIIVISNVKTNTIIEARGYEHGYGKIHEIQLSEQFDGIETYADLFKAYLNQYPLKRRDKRGNIVQTIKDYKILKMRSVFDSPLASRTILDTLPIK